MVLGKSNDTSLGKNDDIQPRNLEAEFRYVNSTASKSFSSLYTKLSICVDASLYLFEAQSFRWRN